MDLGSVAKQNKLEFFSSADDRPNYKIIATFTADRLFSANVHVKE